MLLQLHIKNYALIEEIKVDFHPQFNILTGETGAGKSIILGALGLIMGQRADLNSLFHKDEKCIIEAEFDIRAYDMQVLFEEENLDFEPICILRREITHLNKSRAFINDSPVTLETLKRISSRLIDIHSQHDSVQLHDEQYRFSLLDSFHQNKNLLKQYQTIYGQYQNHIKQLEILQTEFQRASEEHDYKSFLLQELNDSRLDSIQQEEIESERNQLQHTSTIGRGLHQALSVLRDSDPAGIQLLQSAGEQLRSILSYSKEAEKLYDRIHSAQIELEDIAAELENKIAKLQDDPNRLQALNDQLDDLYRLFKKHKVQQVEELILIRDQLQETIHKAEHGQEEIQLLHKKIQDELKALLQLASELHEERISAAKVIEKKVEQYLHQLGMPEARFRVAFTQLREPNRLGTDQIQLLFTANKGHEMRELNKVASGGELSRLMLSIKAILASAIHLPSMIFDEIDTGISGEVAIKTANILSEIAKAHQLICITHLPQVAARAQRHFKVVKETVNGRSSSKLLLLQAEECVDEIARMLSGDKPSQAALENARQLMA